MANIKEQIKHIKPQFSIMAGICDVIMVAPMYDNFSISTSLKFSSNNVSLIRDRLALLCDESGEDNKFMEHDTIVYGEFSFTGLSSRHPLSKNKEIRATEIARRIGIMMSIKLIRFLVLSL